jgi:hypothetical protein
LDQTTAILGLAHTAPACSPQRALQRPCIRATRTRSARPSPLSRGAPKPSKGVDDSQRKIGSRTPCTHAPARCVLPSCTASRAPELSVPARNADPLAPISQRGLRTPGWATPSLYRVHTFDKKRGRGGGCSQRSQTDVDQRDSCELSRGLALHVSQLRGHVSLPPFLSSRPARVTAGGARARPPQYQAHREKKGRRGVHQSRLWEFVDDPDPLML